jgi:neutral ceramidase
MKGRLDSLPVTTSVGRIFKAGWAKSNITPDDPLPIASYGLRKNFVAVHDSLWVRTFVFDNGHSKVAIVTLDLLIFPPEVTAVLMNRLPQGFTSQNVYLSATHTHNGAGGWAHGLGGRLLAGPFNEKYFDKIVSAIISSIEAADHSIEESFIGFDKYPAPFLIRNRLVREDPVDPWLRVIKIRTKSGKTAVLSSFSAHPTCLSSHEDKVSADYPGELVRRLEEDKRVDFAGFMAGAVASVAPREYDKKNYELINFISSNLSKKVLSEIDSIKLSQPEEISLVKLPLALREPHVKFVAGLRLRPWVFYWLLGKSDSFINAVKIGNIVLIGTPCDFSGSLIDEVENIAAKENYQLMITSFNGGYIGYITEDKYYNLPKNETREMNWYGPFNGAYFVEILSDLVEKI